MTMKTAFALKEAARHSELSPQMVMYFCQRGVVGPSKSRRRGRGSRLLFSFADIVMLRTLKRLCDAGVSPKRMASQILELKKRLEIYGPNKPIGSFLVTDGKRIFLQDKNRKLEAPDGQFVFSFVVDVDWIADEVRSSIKKVA